MQFVPGYREQNAPRRTNSGHDTVVAISTETHRTEDNSCAQGKGTLQSTSTSTGTGASTAASTAASTGTPTTWAARRENALDSNRIERGEMSPNSAQSSAAPALVAPAFTNRVNASSAVTEVSETRTFISGVAIERAARTVSGNALDAANAALMGDAPACDGCGSITVRNGTCYRCLNCGNSMGCS